MIVLAVYVLVSVVLALASLYIGVAIGQGQAERMTARYLDRLDVERQSEIMITALIVAAGGEIRCTPVNMALMSVRDTFTTERDLLSDVTVFRHVRTEGPPCPH
jgi:hypothetical protein